MDWQIIYTAIDTYAEDLGPFADLVRAGVLAKQAESDKARQAHAEFQAAELAKQIDVLAMIGELLVVVELKAQPVTERTVGQVMRYKAAVENALTRQIWVTARARGTVYEGEARVQCMVIGPSFHPYAAETLDHFGWSLVARRLDDGSFAIADVYEGASEILLFHAEPDLNRLTGQLAADEVDRWVASRK